MKITRHFTFWLEMFNKKLTHEKKKAKIFDLTPLKLIHLQKSSTKYIYEKKTMNE